VEDKVVETNCYVLIGL